MIELNKREWKRKLFLGVLAGVVVGTVAASSVYKPDIVTVQVAHPTKQDLEATVITSGSVRPVNYFDARASFAGLVEKVDVKVGDKVQPGQMLVQMKDPFARQRIAAAEAELASNEVANENVHHGGSQDDRIGLESDLEHAQMERSAAAASLTTLTQLRANGAASDAEINAATRRLEAANDTLTMLEKRKSARYSVTDQASWVAKVTEARQTLNAQKVTYSNANITSPIAGTVYLAPVAAYDFVQMGDDLLRVADLSKMQVTASFDEPDMGKLHVGQAVKITWVGAPNRAWHGHLEQPPLASMISGSRSIGQCTITIDDANDDLPANTNVIVEVTVQSRQRVLTVPREALHTEGSANFIYRVVGDRLVKTPVGVGIVNLARAEITSGIGASDEVALHLANDGNLKQNMRVKVSS